MALAARKCRRPRRPLAAPADAPPVSLVQPLCGVEPFLEATLESAFALDYPEYELIFCLAHADDPAAPLARRAIERHPERQARLLFGDERPSANPKLNNVVKGWKAARNAWIVIADSNVLMPRDYHPAHDGGLAARRRHRLRAADRRAARESSPPRSNAPSSTPIRRAGNTPPTPAASASPKASRCCGGATSSRRAAA